MSNVIRRWRQRTLREWYWLVRRRLPWGRWEVFPFGESLKIRVDLWDELGLHYATGRAFEPGVTAFLDWFVRPGMAVIDVGANMGHFTLLAAERVGPSGKVAAFEPAPEEFDKLKSNVQLNRLSQVNCFEEAVGDRVGTARLNVCAAGLGIYNSLGRPLREGPTRAVETRLVTLDSRTADFGERINLIKIDVEGGEIDVLKGASGILKRDRPHLLLEFSDPAAAGWGRTSRDLRAAVEAAGYRVCRFDPIGRSLEPEPPRDHYDYANLVAQPASPGDEP